MPVSSDRRPGPRASAVRGRSARPNAEALPRAWAAERAAARAARARGDAGREWDHLERAHILAQPMAGRHLRTHAAMMGSAVRRGAGHEIVGQALRLVLAVPGSITGRYPVGNTGGADVKVFFPMTVPADLRAVLDE